MAGLEIQFIRDEHDGPLYSTMENVIVCPNGEKFDRTIRLGVIGETGTTGIILDTLADGGLGWNLFHSLSLFLSLNYTKDFLLVNPLF
jgi:hypothetical protein